MLDAFDDQEELEFEDDFDDGKDQTELTTNHRLGIVVS